MTGLRDGKILGVRTGDGRVLCPPLEWDPETGDALDLDFVEVGPGGRRRDRGAGSTEPTPKHPLDQPFAFALIKLDGADTAMVHAVDAGSDRTPCPTGHAGDAPLEGERVGRIDDIEAFVRRRARATRRLR